MTAKNSSSAMQEKDCMVWKNAEVLHVKACGIYNYHHVRNTKGIGCDGVNWA